MKKLMNVLLILTSIAIALMIYGIACIGSYIFTSFNEYYGICYIIGVGLFFAASTYVVIKISENYNTVLWIRAMKRD